MDNYPLITKPSIQTTNRRDALFVSLFVGVFAVFFVSLFVGLLVCLAVLFLLSDDIRLGTAQAAARAKQNLYSGGLRFQSFDHGFVAATMWVFFFKFGPTKMGGVPRGFRGSQKMTGPCVEVLVVPWSWW